MAGQPAEQDNSIEEILASIRQIISEDDKPGAPQAPAVSAAPVIEPEPLSPVPAADDVFELVDRVVAEPEPEPAPLPKVEEDPIEVDLREREMEMAAQATPPLPSFPSAPIDLPVADERPLFTDTATAATLGAFSKLSETILIERQRTINGTNITLEDIVKELLAPLLREWIDKNVPAIVERLVSEELEKLARHARDS